MTDPGSSPPPQPSGPIAWMLFPLRVVVAAVVVLDELARPLYRPVADWFASLGLVRRLEALIGRMPPYAVLGILAVPFIGVEPLKILALVWMGQGRLVSGLLLMAAAYAGSFLVIERIYHAGEAQLMRIGWLAVVLSAIGRIRATVLAWARSTRVYAAARVAAGQVRAWRQAVVRAFRAHLGHNRTLPRD